MFRLRNYCFEAYVVACTSFPVILSSTEFPYLKNIFLTLSMTTIKLRNNDSRQRTCQRNGTKFRSRKVITAKGYDRLKNTSIGRVSIFLIQFFRYFISVAKFAPIFISFYFSITIPIYISAWKKR